VNLISTNRIKATASFKQDQTQISVKRESDPAMEQAAELMIAHGVPLDNHSALQENLATYLAHASAGSLSKRWQNKVDRELAKPFTDEQIDGRIDQLQQSLLENVQELPRTPSKLYITGSFSRGRLGANSDLDGYALLKPEDITSGFDSFERRVENQNASCLFPLSEDQPGFNRANLMMAGGATVSIDPSQLCKPGYLRETYQGILANKGPDRRETSAGYEWLTSKMWDEGMSASNKRESFEGKNLRSQLTNAAMALCGTLAGLPAVGSVVFWAANTCVKQHHSEVF
jgi:hypothetical protein